MRSCMRIYTDSTFASSVRFVYNRVFFERKGDDVQE